MEKLFSLIYYLIVPLVAGFVGSVFTTPAVSTWYSGLVKPWFSPPSWLFAPIWSILYIFMGTAAFLVHESKGKKGSAFWFYYLQLAANTLWSIIFFGMRNPLLAFLEIIILGILIYVTAYRFYKIKKLAGYLFIPYFFLVVFFSLFV